MTSDTEAPTPDRTDPSISAGAGTPEPLQTLEPTASPNEPPAARRRSVGRWAIAALVTVLVVAISAVGLIALVGETGSVVSNWSPADAALYIEGRADLPGDQRQNVGSFLAKFPGFADQSTLDQKVAETFDRLIGRASDGKHDWSTEIKPWFGGQVGLSGTGSMTSTSTERSAGPHLLVATQKDPAAATAWIASFETVSPTTESYKGVTLSTYSSTTGTAETSAATNGVLLVGDVASVKAAIDRNGSNGLSGDAQFRAAMSGLDRDQLLRGYVNLKALVERALAAAPAPVASTGLGKSLVDRLPAWVGAGLRAEPAALVGQTVSEHISGRPTTNQVGVIAAKAPASTMLLIEAHDVGASLKSSLDQVRADPSLAPSLDQIDQAAGLLGGLDNLVGWIDDVGLVVTSDGSAPSGGLVVVPTDVAKAESAFASLKTLLTLAVAGGNASIAVSEEPYGNGTITTIDLGDLASLLSRPGLGTNNLPVSGHGQISYTVQNGIVVIGAGPSFVKSVVDVKPGASLADQTRYRAALDQVGAKNLSSVWADLAAIRNLLEPLAAAAPVGSGTYATELKPYLEPLDVFAGATLTGAETDTSRFILSVTKP